MIVRLGDLGEIRGRVGWKGYTKEDLRSSGPLAIGAGQIDKNNKLDLSEPTHLSREKYLESPEIMVKRNDILIVQRGSLGKVVLINQDIGDATINPSMVILRVESSITSPEFVYHMLISEKAKRNIHIENASTGVPMLTQKQIGSFYFPMPPIELQNRVNRTVSEIDSTLQTLTSLISEKNRFKRALMNDLLTGKRRFPEFVPEGGTNYKETKLGMVPEDWEVVKLGDIASTINGLTGKTKADFGEVGAPYIEYLTIFNEAVIRDLPKAYVNINEGERQTEILHGDILFTTSSETPHEVGMSSYFAYEASTPVYLNSFSFGIRLQNDHQAFSEFIGRSMRSFRYRKAITRLAQGSTRFNLSKRYIMGLEVALPGESEASKITQVLNKLDDEISGLSNQVANYQSLKKGVLQRVFK